MASFFWTIENFYMLPHLNHQPENSPDFSIGSYKFRLVLYPRGFKSSQYISLYLQRQDDCGAEEVLIKWILCVVFNKTVFKGDRRFEASIKKNYFCGWEDFLNRDLLTTERSSFHSNNYLTFKFDILELIVNESNEQHRKLDDGYDAEILSRDFSAILNSGKYSDLVIIADKNRFSVHRIILECRCKTLLTHLQPTNVVNEYTLDGIDGHTLQVLLQYLYTGAFSTDKMYEEIQAASETYNIPELRHLLTLRYRKTFIAKTRIAVSKQSFSWIIGEFRNLHVNQEVVYPAFYNAADEWSKVEIILTKIKYINGAIGIQLKFRKLSTSNIDFFICKVYICGDIRLIVKKYEFIRDQQDWVAELGPEIEIRRHLYKDSLNMCFEISASRNEIDSKIENISVETKTEKPGGEVITNLGRLQKNLQSLYDDSASADITLRVGEAEYPAHKAVICTRSPVFAKMFENDTLEKKEGAVTIEDIDHRTMSSMLKYIYCGYIGHMNISEAIKLYGAADKYELLPLREKCATFLKTHIDADHVDIILLLADAHRDNDLRSSVYKYMTSNPRKVRKSANGLRNLKDRLDVYPDILEAFLDHMSNYSNELD